MDDSTQVSGVAMTVNQYGGRQSKLSARFDLVPPTALRVVAEILMVGAEKYGESNWRQITTREHIAHALAHINIYLDEHGETSTEDDLANAACRLLFALEIARVGLGEAAFGNTRKQVIPPTPVANSERTQLQRDIETVQRIADKLPSIREMP